MSFFRVSLVALMVAPSVAFSESDIESFIQGLWTQVAGDDDKLSATEWETAIDNLGINRTIFTEHEGDSAKLFVSLDTNSDKFLTKKEMIGVTNYPSYKDPVIAAFSNGAGQAPAAELPAVPTAISTAQVVIEALLVIATDPSSIYGGQRTRIKNYFAVLAGLPAEHVIVTFLPKVARRKLLSLGKRELQAATGETEVVAKMYFADAAKADTVGPDLASADPTTSPAFSGLSVTSYAATPSTVIPPLPITNLAIAGGGFFLALVVLCSNASFWAGRKARAKRDQGGDDKKGCCKSGCCSYNAVPSWGFAEIVAAVVIFAAVGYVYTEVTGVTDAIVGLIAIILKLLASSLDLVKEFSGQIPAAVVDPLRQYSAQLELLHIGVVVPGVLAGVLLLLAGLLPTLCKGMNKGSYCFTKLIILSADVFLLLSFVFYIGFAAFSIVFQYVPVIKNALGTVRGTCDIMPATLNQMLADNQAAIDKVAAISPGSADVIALQGQLNNITEIGVLIDDGCGLVLQFIDAMMAMFFPGVLCVIAILFALFVNKSLCCVAGCCCFSPGKGEKVAAPEFEPTKAPSKGDQLQSV